MIQALASAYCRLPNFRGKSRLFGYLFRRLPFQFARSKYGILLAHNINDATYRFAMAGAYGSFISDIIANKSQPFVFLDIGANQGLYSLLAAKNDQCERVWSFEPNPHTFALLKKNIGLNNSTSDIETICGAIADVDAAELEFTVPTGHSGAANMFERGEKRFKAMRVRASEMRTLFDRRNSKDVLAKIDVEGAEMSVLNAMKNYGVLDQMSGLIVEVNNATGTNDQSLHSFLEANGWRLKMRSSGDSHFDAYYENQHDLK